MATFTELCAEVVTITKRPDLVDDTKLAVKAATLKMHQSDYFVKDIYETGIRFSEAGFTQQFDLKQLVPQFRALKYFRFYDNSQSGAPGPFFAIKTPAQIVNEYGVDRTNICYLAGDVLNVKSKLLLEYALLGVYLNPIVTESDYTSWVARDHPYAIVFEAARLLFKQIGYDEQSSVFDKLSNEQLAELKLTNIEAVGY